MTGEAGLTTIKALISRALGRSGPLVLSRLASATLTFALPLVLVRLLSPDGFGVYKQFFLVAQTTLLVGQLGVTQSLYYFLPRGGQERGSFVAQALLLLLFLGALAGGGLYLGAPLLGRSMDPRLAELRLPLGLFAGLMLAAAPLEGALTAEGRIGSAALAYVLSDAARAAALTLGALLHGADGLFWAAVLVSALRLCALWLLVATGRLPMAPARAPLLRSQLAFALPFAGATWLYVGQRYFAQYAVSARFPAATFALFTVAAFHLPVVDIVFTPITEILMVELGRGFSRSGQAPRHSLGAAASPRSARLAAPAAWHDAVEKLASLLFPAACGAWLFGPTVLPILFTHKFAAAVPLFMLATVEIPLWILPCDALLRAAGDTRFLFLFNAGRIVLTGVCVLLGIRLGGLGGAIAGGIVSEALARAGMLARGRRFLGGGELLDRVTLTRIGLAALLACVPGGVIARAPYPVPVRLTVGAISYAAVYFVLRARLLARRPVTALGVEP
jgi:O-antigen/teichoic acid export membrane protein